MKQKSQTKDMHFLPVMFLKGFVNQNGHIFMLDRKKDKISQPRNPETVAYERHLYSPSVEDKFQRIENSAAPLLEKIRSKGFNSCSHDDIFKIIDFVVYNFVRSPLATRVSENALKDKEVQEQMRAIHKDEAARIIKACAEKKGQAFEQTLDLCFQHRRNIITKNFDVFLTTSVRDAPPFILNDRYTCWQILDSIPYLGRDVDWSYINAEMYCPISNAHCVIFSPKKDLFRKGSTKMICNKKYLSKKHVKMINQLSLGQVDRYAYSAEKAELLSQVIS